MWSQRGEMHDLANLIHEASLRRRNMYRDRQESRLVQLLRDSCLFLTFSAILAALGLGQIRQIRQTRLSAS